MARQNRVRDHRVEHRILINLDRANPKGQIKAFPHAGDFVGTAAIRRNGAN